MFTPLVNIVSFLALITAPLGVHCSFESVSVTGLSGLVHADQALEKMAGEAAAQVSHVNGGGSLVENVESSSLSSAVQRLHLQTDKKTLSLESVAPKAAIEGKSSTAAEDLFKAFKEKTCPSSRHLRKRGAIPTAVAAPSSSASTCASLEGGTDAFRNKVNGHKVNGLCYKYHFWSLLLWDPKSGQLYRDKAKKFPRDTYTCEHMVCLNPVTLSFSLSPTTNQLINSNQPI